MITKEQQFINNYTDHDNKDTFGNAFQSALQSGYSESYSKNITSLRKGLLSEIIGKITFVEQINKNIQDLLIHEDVKIKFAITKLLLEQYGKLENEETLKESYPTSIKVIWAGENEQLDKQNSNF